MTPDETLINSETVPENNAEIQIEQTETPIIENSASEADNHDSQIIEQPEISAEINDNPILEETVVSDGIIPSVINEAISQQTELVTEQVESSAGLEETTVVEIEVEPVIDEAAKAEAKAISEEKKRQREAAEAQQKLFSEYFEYFKTVRDKDETLEVDVIGRIKGGLRVMYKEMPLFLPASHFSLKRSPTEKELSESVGIKTIVKIHEMQEDRIGRKTVIVTRKKILEEEFWAKIQVGDIVEGNVSSVATFGVFVDIGGVEGLIHISRISQNRVEDPKTMFRRGQKIQAVVIEANKEKNRIALSRKELEKSPWDDLAETVEVGSVVKGIVRRMTDFGAYIELFPGIDGLLRSSEFSWTKRIRKPSDILKISDEIDVKILTFSKEKRSVSLSIKQIQPNPWHTIKEKFENKSEYDATVKQIVNQGIVVALDEEFDGFMPRSKMKNCPPGKPIPYQVGEVVKIRISDINIEEESLIVEPVVEEKPVAPRANHGQSRGRDNQRHHDNKPHDQNSPNAGTDSGAFSLGDLLSDNARSSLFNSSK
ncbi:MAG: S1 RNA-binding domain-containing protein [Candidatus Kapabacteria bacterium]|nr:S1 RNA-binding domain-containing protein [Candidatus Kapabacteria bacterium]